MGDLNSKHNRVVWVDVPIKDLDRASAFYAAVLNCSVDRQSFDGLEFGVIEHHEGNGGCLAPNATEISASAGILVYFNVDGRIRDAVAKVEHSGGKVTEPIHSIGPHGFRALAIDSEGNRIALHSNSDQ